MFEKRPNCCGNLQRRTALGQILQDKGFISHEVLQESLIAAKATGKLLGETLLSSKHVSHEALVEAIRFQVGEVAVMNVIFWQEGEFRYSDCTQELGLQAFEGARAAALILEAAVLMDDADAA